MTKEEVLAINNHCIELAKLLEVPIELFTELMSWSAGRVNEISEGDGSGFWRSLPNWNVFYFQLPKRQVELILKGRLINKEVRFVNKIMSEFEYEYSVKSGNDCAFLKEVMKAELIANVAKEFLEFKIL